MRFFILGASLLLFACSQAWAVDGNQSVRLREVVRVIAPGIFDCQSSDYLVRFSLWGVGFPKNNQPGYDQALSFCEGKLLGSKVSLVVKKEFNQQNIKLAEVFIENETGSLNMQCIKNGMGWHNEAESLRHGPFVLAQIRSKRANIGVWSRDFDYQQPPGRDATPNPVLPSILGKSPFFSGLKYWVTSFGKVHRPECSFYQRGRGELTSRPRGTDCRICGGFKGRD
jgi:hypothetical protein